MTIFFNTNTGKFDCLHQEELLLPPHLVKTLLIHKINSYLMVTLVLGSDNNTVVNVVSKYYDLARSGTEPLFFLDCTGYEGYLKLIVTQILLTVA